ncbi:hypothetical protein SASPL_102282 [Salvia splendens]|uniref:Uncharacterized protein n=1 Tax=Salvia splendens TaxID=180675 RepID=A0A8X9ACP7_SALSN|nr:hypothetical protein SASPL_102282 [Salvia splendens]
MQTTTSRGLARKLKTAGSDSASSPNPITKPPNDPTSKAIDRRLPPPEDQGAAELMRVMEAKKQLKAMAAEHGGDPKRLSAGGANEIRIVRERN